MIWGSCNTSDYMLCADEKYLTMATGCCDRRPEQQDPHEDPAEVDVGQEDHQALVHVAGSCSSPRLAQAMSSGCKQIFVSTLSLVLTLAFVAY